MHFTKMHGLGNDFIIIEENQITKDPVKLTQELCKRRLGVGADGVMIVCLSKIADIKMRIINADGSEAQMCGNGIRCFAKYVYEKGIVTKNKMDIETLAGIMRPSLEIKDGKVVNITIDMGEPDFSAKNIPVLTSDPMDFEVEVFGEKFQCASVLMGVPHTVIFCDDISKIDVEKWGKAIESHSLFPKKTNVNFVTVLNDTTLKISTWERGAGKTYACGTGSCAAALIAHKKGFVKNKVTVLPEIKELIIEYKDHRIFMTGEAVFVFEGDMVQM